MGGVALDNEVVLHSTLFLNFHIQLGKQTRALLRELNPLSGLSFLHMPPTPPVPPALYKFIVQVSCSADCQSPEIFIASSHASVISSKFEQS